VSFAAITIYVASQRLFIVVVVVVYFFIDSVRKLLDTPSCVVEVSGQINGLAALSPETETPVLTG
jgi:hypothetical protein